MEAIHSSVKPAFADQSSTSPLPDPMLHERDFDAINFVAKIGDPLMNQDMKTYTLRRIRKGGYC